MYAVQTITARPSFNAARRAHQIIDDNGTMLGTRTNHRDDHVIVEKKVRGAIDETAEDTANQKKQRKSDIIDPTLGGDEKSPEPPRIRPYCPGHGYGVMEGGGGFGYSYAFLSARPRTFFIPTAASPAQKNSKRAHQEVVENDDVPRDTKRRRVLQDSLADRKGQASLVKSGPREELAHDHREHQGHKDRPTAAEKKQRREALRVEMRDENNKRSSRRTFKRNLRIACDLRAQLGHQSPREARRRQAQLRREHVDRRPYSLILLDRQLSGTIGDVFN